MYQRLCIDALTLQPEPRSAVIAALNGVPKLKVLLQLWYSELSFRRVSLSTQLQDFLGME
jgi:hypothetical protein